MTINRLNRGGSLSRITGGISASAVVQATGGNSILFKPMLKMVEKIGRQSLLQILIPAGPFDVIGGGGK